MDELGIRSLRAALNRQLSGDGIQVRIVQSTSLNLHVYASRVNGTATLRHVQVSLDGAEMTADLVTQVADLIRGTFDHH